jgi:RimJ/RimL family protein N-acetyltransferase
MINAKTRTGSWEVRPVSADDADSILAVYTQCEDFLALGPNPAATMEMVRKDIAQSKDGGGTYCGIYADNGSMVGIVDYVPNHYQGEASAAYLSLLMIASPFRKRGIGKAVVDAVEKYLGSDFQVAVIYSAVQVNNPEAMRFWRKNGYRIIGKPKEQPDQTITVELKKELRKIEDR